MAARMLPAAPVSVSSCSRSPLSRRTGLLLPHPPSLSPALGRKPLLGDPLLLASGAFSPVPHIRRRRAPLAAAVASILPIGKPEGAASAEKLPKWSLRALKSLCMAELEARKFKYVDTGSESLVMGILVEGTSLAAKFLRANGVTLFKLRDETIKLLGKGDMTIYSPLSPPLTKLAQRALDAAVDEKLKSGAEGELTASHLLLGVWSVKECAGHKILAALGLDDDKFSEFAKSADKDVELNHRQVKA